MRAATDPPPAPKLDAVGSLGKKKQKLVERLARAHLRFALRLARRFGKGAGGSGNFAFSPYSIASALSMTVRPERRSGATAKPRAEARQASREALATRGCPDATRGV